MSKKSTRSKSPASVEKPKVSGKPHSAGKHAPPPTHGPVRRPPFWAETEVPDSAIPPKVDIIEPPVASHGPKSRRERPPPPPVPHKKRVGHPPPLPVGPKPTRGPVKAPPWWAYYEGEVDPKGGHAPRHRPPDSKPASKGPKSKPHKPRKPHAPTTEEAFAQQYGITPAQIAEGEKIADEIEKALDQLEQEHDALGHAIEMLSKLAGQGST